VKSCTLLPVWRATPNACCRPSPAGRPGAAPYRLPACRPLRRRGRRLPQRAGPAPASSPTLPALGGGRRSAARSPRPLRAAAAFSVPRSVQAPPAVHAPVCVPAASKLNSPRRLQPFSF
jgi:hypothetical protein